MAVDLSAIGAQVSSRFQLVNAVPATTLVIYCTTLVWSGAFGAGPSVPSAVRHLSAFTLQDAAIGAFAIFLLALLMNPFQTKMVKLLEGYLKPSGANVLLLKRGLQRHDELRFRLNRDKSTQWRPTRWQRIWLSRLPSDIRTEFEYRYRAWCGTEAQKYPPIPDRTPDFDPLGNQIESVDRLMPSRLGNALRVYEDYAGDRYGIPAVSAVSYLFGIASDIQLELINDAQTELDVTVKFVYVWWLATIASILAFYNDGPWLFVALGTFLLSWMSYLAAVSAALVYGEGLARVIDLHRFDLMQKLRWPLPARPADEAALNRSLWSVLNGDPDPGTAATPYKHPK